MRVSLSDFSLSGVSVLDLAAIDNSLRGFATGTSHGGFGYLSPYYDNTAYSGKVVQFSLSDFSPSGAQREPNSHLPIRACLPLLAQPARIRI